MVRSEEMGALEAARAARPLVVAAEPAPPTAERAARLRLQERRMEPRDYPEHLHRVHHVGVHLSGPAVVDASWPGRPVTSWRVAPGSVHVMPAGVPHRCRWRTAADWVEIELAPELFAGEGIVELRPAIGVEDPLVAQIALALLGEARAGRPGGALYAESLAAALAAHLVRKHGAREASRRPYRGGLAASRLRQVVRHVEEHLDEDLALEQLAALVGMNVYSFVRAFKQSTGAPPHQYVVARRIERAQALLGDPSLSIADVALRCGFAGQSNFTTAFRRLTGTTPGAHRAVVLGVDR